MNAADLTLDSLKTDVPRYLPWLVVFSAALFFFYEFIQMNMFNTINPYLMKDFGISATAMGYVTAAYFYADVIFLFPAGMLLDRFSTRKVILTAMFICVVSTALFARSHSIEVVAICHFAAGIGNAFCFLSCIRLASRWFSNRQMALVVGLIVTMAMLGGMVAQTPLTWLVAKVGWRDALMWVATLGTLIIILVWFVVQDYPPNTKHLHQAHRQQLKALGVWESVRRVIVNKQNWFCGFYTSFMNLPLMVLGGSWGKMYLMTVQHVSDIQASYISMVLFFGTMIGCPLIGWFSDRIALRRMPMIVFAIISLPVMLGIIYLSQLTFVLLMSLFFLLGLFTAAQTIAYPVIAESSAKSVTSTAMGLASVLIMGGPAVFDPLFGWLMDKQWDGTIVNGAHVYAAHAYDYAMLTLPLMLFIGLLAALFIRETNAREAVD